MNTLSPESTPRNGIAFLEVVMLVLLACILAAVVVPGYIAWSSEARRVQCWENQAAVRATVVRQAARNDGALPDSLVPSLFPGETIPPCPDMGSIRYTKSGDAFTIDCTLHGGAR